MRKVVLGLAMVMVVMGLVGCGPTEEKKDGFVPEQVTESEVVTDDVKENIEEVVDTENLQKYYDVTKVVGTPRLEIGIIKYNKVFDYTEVWSETAKCMIGNTSEVKPDKSYKCIICDNNTPDDYTDDVVAYIFTTPIEE